MSDVLLAMRTSLFRVLFSSHITHSHNTMFSSRVRILSTPFLLPALFPFLCLYGTVTTARQGLLSGPEPKRQLVEAVTQAHRKAADGQGGVGQEVLLSTGRLGRGRRAPHPGETLLP